MITTHHIHTVTHTGQSDVKSSTENLKLKVKECFMVSEKINPSHPAKILYGSKPVYFSERVFHL